MILINLYVQGYYFQILVFMILTSKFISLGEQILKSNNGCWEALHNDFVSLVVLIFEEIEFQN